MSAKLTEQEVHSIVLLGDFNPSIFHPTWFSLNDLLPAEETEAVAELLITREVATYDVSDINVQVESHRFGLTTKDSAKAPVIRDLAMGSFGLLEHTPLQAVGLNLDVEVAVEGIEQWHKIGHRLAPKATWETILEHPGMRGIHIEGKRPDCPADVLNIRVQPSNPSKGIYGVIIRVNQHYNIDPKDEMSVRARNDAVMRILQDDWKSFRPFALRAAEQIISG